MDRSSLGMYLKNTMLIIAGNYLVVFGGYSHRHNKEEICYDNQMYLYHLGCHAWVSHDILNISDKGKRCEIFPKLIFIYLFFYEICNNNYVY